MRFGFDRRRRIALFGAIIVLPMADRPSHGDDSSVAFTDVTAVSGIIAPHAPSALLETGPIIFGLLCGGGVAGDFNNDGFTDIFVVVGGKFPDALYINNGNGTFTNRAVEWNVAVKHMGLAAAVGDYDRDGWLDLFVTSAGPEGSVPAAGKHRLYRNSGAGSFIEVAASAGVSKTSPSIPDGTGAAFGDYDLDGDLDLYVCGWVGPSNGNRLFRNNGNGTFSDVSIAAGLTTNGMRGFSPRFVDMDGDRYPELLITCDFGTSRYYVNNRDGTFSNATASSGTGLDANGMGATVGDCDNDGALDWYVTSIWTQTPIPSVPGTGNMLYRSVGKNLFIEQATPAGVSQAGWAWGTTFVDLDHDGWLDLVATNGWSVYPEFVEDKTRVWWNKRDGSFADVSNASGLIHKLDSRGLLTIDLENDGDRDIIIFTNHGAPRVLRNDVIGASGGAGRADANWIRLALNTTGAPRLAPNGAGTLVRFTTGTLSQIRPLDLGTNFQSQNEMTVHAGLGAAAIVDIRVEWSDGTVTLMRDVPANQSLTIASGERCDLDVDGRVDGGDLGLLLEAWGSCQPDDPRDLNADGEVEFADLLLLVAAWSPRSG